MRKDVGLIFVQEFVILFGFLNGLWIHIGVNPETEIWIGVLILTIAPIWASYVIGKWLGLIAVFLAFIGGIFIDTISVWFLVGGVMNRAIRTIHGNHEI